MHFIRVAGWMDGVGNLGGESVYPCRLGLCFLLQFSICQPENNDCGFIVAVLFPIVVRCVSLTTGVAICPLTTG